MTNPFEDDDPLERRGGTGRNFFDSDSEEERTQTRHAGGGVPNNNKSNNYTSNPDSSNCSGSGSSQQQSLGASRTRNVWDEVERLQQSTLSATENSLRHLDESERTGLQTAQDLLHQREQMSNIERNLDHMDSNLTQSQRHINSIKSLVVGGVKNMFGKKQANVKNPSTTAPASGSLSKIVDARQGEQTMPAANEASYEKSSTSFDSAAAGRHGGSGVSDAYEERFARNVDAMAGGVSRLKNLAFGLSGEIEEQNRMLDGLSDKSERVGGKVQYQDGQLRKILKK